MFEHPGKLMRHVDAPKAWAAADRELQGGMLQYDEKVERKTRVFVRRPTDYYRGANGVLYATNRRLIFIGIAPGSKLENEDAPPVIVSQEFPNDTWDVTDKRPDSDSFLTGASRHDGNGFLTIEGRRDDEFIRSLLSTLDDPTTHTAVTAERALLDRLQGGCQVPIAAYATIEQDRLSLAGLVCSTNGTTLVRDSINGSTVEAYSLGTRLGDRLLAAGGAAILQEIYGHA